MELNSVNELSKNIEESNRTAILQLIDLKTESDMEKVLTKMDGLNFEIRNQEVKMESLRSEFKTILWVVGTAMTIMVAVLALK